MILIKFLKLLYNYKVQNLISEQILLIFVNISIFAASAG